jgi:hypothetical protein
MDKNSISVICPKNDLESYHIIQIAKKLGIDVRTSKQPWGASLRKESGDFLKDLKDNVIIVEMPNPVQEEVLKKKHNVFIIDHHCMKQHGVFMDRSNIQSSIEQFAILLDYELSQDEKYVAMNDKSYLWQLITETQLSSSEINQFRERELALQGYDDVFMQQSQSDYDNRKEYSNFTLIFTKLKKVARIQDLAHFDYLNSGSNGKSKFEIFRQIPLEMFPPNILIVQLNDDDQPVRINFSGQYKYVKDFKEIADNLSSSIDYWFDHFSGIAGCFGAAAPNPIILEELLEKVVSSLVLFDRPVLKYSTIFFIPFKMHERCRPGLFWKRTANFSLDKNYDEHVYFHDFVSDFIFEQKRVKRNSVLKPVEYFEPRTADKKLSLQIVMPNDNSSSLEFPITHMAIHKFYNNVGILAIQVTAEENGDTKQKLWRALREQAYPISLFAATKFNKMARIIYKSFEMQQQENQIPQKVRVMEGKNVYSGLEHDFTKAFSTPPKNSSIIISHIFKSLIERFSGNDNFEILLDDRAIVYSFLALKGPMPHSIFQHEQLNQMFSRILYIDDPGSEYVYEPKFINTLMNTNLYKRWAHYGNLYGYTRYSSVYLGYEAFFKEEVFKQFNSMYYQLALLSLFYRVTLLDFSKRIVGATNSLIKKRNRCDFKKLRKEFVRFHNVYWFKEITNQDQGIEIFDLYRNALEFDKIYEQVKDEIERANDVEASHFQNRITIGGKFIGIVALLIGYFGTDFTGLRETLSNSLIFSTGATVAIFLLILFLSLSVSNDFRKHN